MLATFLGFNGSILDELGIISNFYTCTDSEKNKHVSPFGRSWMTDINHVILYFMEHGCLFNKTRVQCGPVVLLEDGSCTAFVLFG